MILIADSGSTKADWILINDHEVVSEFQTEGLNPVHLSEEIIFNKFSSENKLKEIATSVQEVHFFGAGCGNEEGKSRMVSVLTNFFSAANVAVDNDLMAAAIATCGNEKGIVCILGTGSNCCYFDGENIHTKNFGLGYILGDEGSGAYFGKLLLRAYLYNQMPKELSESFRLKYELTRESILESVYRKPNANLFLSSFMPFIIQNKYEGWIKDLINQGLNEFFESNVVALVHSKSLPINFVGSIASELEAAIRKKGTEKKLTIGKIMKQPKEGLSKFFLEKAK